MIKEGWNAVYNSKKFHYFKEGRSLCKKYGLLGYEGLQADNGKPSIDDCKACSNKLRKNHDSR